MSIEDNVTTRKHATDIIDYALDVAKSEEYGPESVRLLFRNIIELACSVVDEQVLCRRCKKQLIGREKEEEELKRARAGAPPLEDDDLMPFGKHKDKPMDEVPDSYLEWFLEQDWCDRWPSVKSYAEEALSWAQ